GFGQHVERQRQVVGGGRLLAAQALHRLHQLCARGIGVALQFGCQARVPVDAGWIADADQVAGGPLDHVLERDLGLRRGRRGFRGRRARCRRRLRLRRRRLALAGGEQEQQAGGRQALHGNRFPRWAWTPGSPDGGQSRRPRVMPVSTRPCIAHEKAPGVSARGSVLRLTLCEAYSACTSSACRPFWPCTTLNETFWPSCSDLKPLPWIERKWTNRSWPLSGVMKPKPLASLNHLTIPV